MQVDDADFVIWQENVIKNLRVDQMWPELTIDSIDWDEWLGYFRDGLSPEEAVREELYAA